MRLGHEAKTEFLEDVHAKWSAKVYKHRISYQFRRSPIIEDLRLSRFDGSFCLQVRLVEEAKAEFLKDTRAAKRWDVRSRRPMVQWTSSESQHS